MNTPEKYAALTGVTVLTGKEAIRLDAASKSVAVKDVATGEEEMLGYDKLVISVGASPSVPPVKGMGLSGRI